MTAPPPHETPRADRDLEWDWSSNATDYTNELLDEGGWGSMAAAHAWSDTSDNEDPPQTKQAYKLPHHRVIDGQIRVVLEGVRSAMNILAATRFQPQDYRVDLPADEVAGVYEHLAAHLRQFDEDPPDILKGWSSDDGWPPI
ncbi:MAG: hypothetical protein M3N57_07015 [Actinomycetota bacterium]|nr:hypothetical protein [Actinomycetota bacterium]